MSLDDLKPAEEIKTSIESIQLFLSFDIVGSTQYKESNKDNWVEMVKEFYKKSEEEIKGIDKSFKVLKYMGDEVLFYREINNYSDINNSVKTAYKTLHFLADWVESISNKLSIKSTIWMAPIDNQNNFSIHDNKDFIGIHLDQGFRVAGNFAKRRQLALSFEISYCLAKGDKDRQVFCLVDYRELKGVWKGNYYPVVWYSESDKKESLKLPYDQRYKCDLTDNFINIPLISGDNLINSLYKVETSIDKLKELMIEIDIFLESSS